MVKFYHRNLAAGRWSKLSLVEQMANVGSEVERVIAWRGKGESERSKQAFYRVLELLDLTLIDAKNRNRLREPLRVREALVDYFDGQNRYGSTDELWSRYFLAFARAARKTPK